MLEIEREESCLRQLRELIKEDESLTDFQEFFDDKFLLHFVRGKKYDTDRAFSTLQSYIGARTDKYRDMFLNLTPTKIKLHHESTFLPLKKTGKTGFVAVSRVQWWPMEGLTFEDFLSKNLLVFEEIWNDEDAERNGITLIVDFEGFGMKHARLLGDYRDVQKALAIFYKAMPLKYKMVHCLNAPLYFRMLHNFVKKFLPTKLVERMNFHGSGFDALHDEVPSDILPTWLGGPLSDELAFDTEFNETILKKDDYYLSFIEKLK